jgi:multiple sugar transport system ATP-binding protein
MRAELARIRDRVHTTTVYVTHDQVEAMTLGDRVAVLKDGVLQQVETPQQLFNAPANVFVGAFIGSPSMNLVEATISDDGTVAFAGFTLPMPSGRDLSAYARRTVILGIRPSSFDDADLHHREGLPIVEVTPDVTEELGTEVHVIFTIDAPPVVIDALVAAYDENAVEDLLPLGDGRSAFTARVDSRTKARPRQPVRLAVDPSEFHFFDPGTGEAIGSIARAGAASTASPS